MSVAPDVVFTRDLVMADILLGMPKSLRPPVVYESHGYAPVWPPSAPRRSGRARRPRRRKMARLTARELRVWDGAAGYVTLTRVHQQELEDRFGARANSAVFPTASVSTAHARSSALPD